MQDCLEFRAAGLVDHHRRPVVDDVVDVVSAVDVPMNRLGVAIISNGVALAGGRDGCERFVRQRHPRAEAGFVVEFHSLLGDSAERGFDSGGG